MMEKHLLQVLDDLAARDEVADFWLRDDDATQPTTALDRLLALSQKFAVPMTLAVIPQPTGKALARHLDGADTIEIAVHGWAHKNHAGANEKTRELGLHRDKEIVLGELAAGFSKLKELHQNRFVPMLVPPWNRIDDAIIADLGGLGYQALSVYGPERPGPVKLINTHVDVIDWRGTRGGKDHDLLLAETAARVAEAQDTCGSTGILTHHLDHDDRVWSFLDRLLSLTAHHPACRWRSSKALIALPSP